MTPTLRAALWMSGAVASFTVMAVAGRAALTELDTFETMFFRSLIGIPIVVLALALTGRLGEISTAHFGTHVLRNIAHFTGQNLWFFALPLIPLSLVFALEFTTPLWVLVLAALFLGERLTLRRAGFALLGFIGILIAARPGVVPLNAGTLTAVLAAIAFATTYMLTKRLTGLASVGCILFWLPVIQAVIGAVVVLWDGEMTLPGDATWLPVIAISCAGLLAHLCIANALTLAPAAVVAPMEFVRLPVIAIVGLVLYGEALDPFVLLGAVVIFAANYLNIRNEGRAAAAASPPG